MLAIVGQAPEQDVFVKLFLFFGTVAISESHVGFQIKPVDFFKPFFVLGFGLESSFGLTQDFFEFVKIESSGFRPFDATNLLLREFRFHNLLSLSFLI